MRIAGHLHDWDVDYRTARRLQEKMARRVLMCPLPKTIRLVAGADMAIDRLRDKFIAAVVVLRYPDMEPVEEVVVRAPAVFPYIPGLLTFREGPAVLAAMHSIRSEPDVVMFDGQGLAHPRRLGLASHMGLWLGRPTVGAAKSRLIGEHRDPGPNRGNWARLMDRGEQIGSVLRTRAGVRPLYVSPGHLCDHAGARRIVLNCCVRYRLPEPTRQAHAAVKRARGGS